MKKETMYILLAIMFISNIIPVVAVPNKEQTVPNGYVRLSDVGIYGIIYPNAEDKLISKGFAEKLESDFAGSDMQKFRDEILRSQENSQINKKKPSSSILIQIPESGSEDGILSSAAVTFSSGVTKLWTKTYTGTPTQVYTIQDVTGDKLDDALVVVRNADNHYDLYVIKGNNGQVLWKWSTSPGQLINWNIIPDVSGDGARDVLLTTSKAQSPGYSYSVYVVKGNTGVQLWKDPANIVSSEIAYPTSDLNGDGIIDIIIEKNKLNTVTFTSTYEVVAKKGRDGVQLWKDTTSLVGSMFGFTDTVGDLNGDALPDVIIQKFGTNFLTGMSSFNVNAKIGKNGIALWNDGTSLKGNLFGFALPLADLNKDHLVDVLIEKLTTDSTTKVSTYEVKARVGKNGAQLWKDTSSITNGNVYNTLFIPWPVGDMNADGTIDFLFDIVKKSSTGSVNRNTKVIRGNNGVSIWSKADAIPKGWINGMALPLGDLNKDNRIDIFFSDYRKNSLSTTDYILTTKAIQARNGGQLWSEILHGKLSQWSVIPSYPVYDLNGDTYNDVLLQYDNFGNKTIKAKKGNTGTVIWQKPFTKTISSEVINVYPSLMPDINGDSLFDVLFDIIRTKSTSQSETLQARIGKTGTVKWQDSISGIVANYDINYVPDMNGDSIYDLLINGFTRGSTTKKYLYKVKNQKTGIDLWSESMSTSNAVTYGQLFGVRGGDLKGVGKESILKYSHPSTNSFSLSAKQPPTGTNLWTITSNKDINALNTNSNFNGDVKDDILFQTFRDIYAITTK